MTTHSTSARRRSQVLGLLLTVTATLATAGAGRAQDYEHVAPKLPAPGPPPVVTPPPAAAPATPAGPAGVILPVLKGVVFRRDADGLTQAAAVAQPGGVDTTDVPELADPAFRARVQTFVGHPFTTDDLARLTAETRAWLVRHDRPFVDVVVPPQNVNGGVVRVVVTRYRLGAIKVVGNRYFSKSLILRSSGLEPGQPLSASGLREDMARLNENPFLNVNAVFKPGDQPGTTDLELRAADRFPLRVYAGYDNEGYPTLGLQEFDVGFNWGNAFGTGQILSYQYTQSFNGHFSSHSASDVIPLPWNDKLLVFGSYARVVPHIGEGFNDVGHSGQASARYVHPVSFGSAVQGHLQAGYDFKTTDNNLEFQGFRVIANAAEVDQFLAVLDGTETDRYGQTAFENDLVFAPGELTGANTDAAFQGLVPGARARYVYDRLSVTRTTTLPARFTWVARVTVQAASAILPNSEQLGGGGVGSVRGYYPDTGLGSNGVLVSQELRTPSFSLARVFDRKSELSDALQSGIFFDYAHLYQPYYVVGGPQPLDLASAGFLIHYSVSRAVNINFDMGFRLRSAPTQPTKGAYGSVSLMFAY